MIIVVVQSLSSVWLFVTMPDFPILHYFPEFAQTHVHCVGNDIQPSHPLPAPSLPAPNLSQHPMSQLFASGGQFWSFSFSISPSNEYSGLISFRVDWFDLLAVPIFRPVKLIKTSTHLFIWIYLIAYDIPQISSILSEIHAKAYLFIRWKYLVPESQS